MSDEKKMTEITEANANQFLTFFLAGEEYGVPILRVQGIQGWGGVTPIPQSPDYVLGVTNLRGAIVPIVDLRKRFDLPAAEFGPTTVVIVLKIEDETQDRVIGIVVDAVSEVYRLEDGAMQPAPEFGEDVDTRFIKGLATVDEKMLILLNIDGLLKVDEMEELEAATEVA
jgi:purine-binding chemotaxis protein CheW